MCGIVGGIAERDLVPILMEGLRRLEYRGYDSAGVAVLDRNNHLQRIRSVGKVSCLQELIDAAGLHSILGIAHTRWATHGIPSERNAHPHMSGERVAVVHNGIIENHSELRAKLEAEGYVFTSETDTEVIRPPAGEQTQARGRPVRRGQAGLPRDDRRLRHGGGLSR